MIGGGNWSLLESNDGALIYDGLWSTVVPIAGIGPIRFESSNDAFSLLPEFHQSSIDFAYIVTPVGEATVGSDVRLTLGLLGSGIVNAGEEGGAAFGYDGNPDVVVPFTVPEPSNGLKLLLGSIGLIGLRFRNRKSTW